MSPEVQQVVAPAFINWQLNFWDLLMIAAAAAVLYSRLTRLETQMAPIWAWWNALSLKRHPLEERV